MQTLCMKFFFLLITFLLPTPSLHGWFLDPDLVRIANKSPIELFVAIYYVRNGTGYRTAGPFYLPLDNAVHIELPSPKFLHTRRLIATSTPEELSEEKDLSTMQEITLGLFNQADYTVTLNPMNAAPHICDTATWRTYAPIPTFTPILLAHEPLAAEKEFMIKRMLTTQRAQERYCSQPLTRPLHIGFCASGGGFRAMLATAGVVSGLEQLGILPMIDTCLGLSGSTWFLFPWVLSRLDPTAYTAQLVHWLGQGIIHHIAQQYHDFATIIATKKAHQLYISGIDMYGISLAYTLLKPLHATPLALTTNDIAEVLKPEDYPLIIGSAVTRPQPSDPYEWVTCSPFAMTLLNDHLTVPSALVGAQFHNHQQLTAPPAPLLCYLLGIFGSSFSISIRDALERVPEALQPLLHRILPESWHTKSWINAKITAAKIANPRYKTDHSSHAAIKSMALVDGGYLNNLPLEPCVRASATPYDLLIVLDCKQERPNRIKALRHAVAALKADAPWLPEIDETAITLLPFSVHGNPASGPVVIYCTVEGDEAYDATFNPAADPAYATPRLIYPFERAERLSRYMTQVITSHKEVFESIIKTLGERVKPQL
ncbi:MAG: cytosolic phospholipase [Candidatus Dependentiae bacterium]|nr:cytosolic phospholipase [Candidatus Dependentiae bacterium]